MMELVAHRATFEGKLTEKHHAWPPVWLRPFAKNEPLDRWPELSAKTKDPKAEELQTLWPEIIMAQADCYACHHDLKSKSWRQQRGYVGKPGRPQLQSWPFALLPSSLGRGPGGEGAGQDSPDATKTFAAAHKKLFLAFDAQPFGIAKDVALAAAELEGFAAKMHKPNAPVTRETATKLITVLLAKGSSEILDYDSARQIAWATRVIYSEWKQNTSHEKAIDELFTRLDDELNLTLGSEARKSFAADRFQLTRELAKSDKEFAAKLKDQQFLSRLQKIHDAELSESLARVSNYDALGFKRRMEQLSALILDKRAGP